MQSETESYDEPGEDEHLKILVPLNIFEDDDEHDEYIIEEPENETLIQYEEGTVNENLDMKVRFDLEFSQTTALSPIENFVIFIEWNNDDLMFYLGREGQPTISGMLTVIMTNRKTGDKTIGQLASTLGFNNFIRPLKFEKVMCLFSHKIYVEFEFERDDTIMEKRWITTFLTGGMLQMEEEQLMTMQDATIDQVKKECRPTTSQNVFDYYELMKIRKLCATGLTARVISSLHGLSDKYDVRILMESQGVLGSAPISILEFLIVAEVYDLHQIKARTLARLTKQSEVKILSYYAKYLGPKVIKDLLKLFKYASSTGAPQITTTEIAPVEETEIMKTVLVSWTPKTTLRMPVLQLAIDEAWTKTELLYSFEISSDDSLVVLKQIELQEQPARPATVAACRMANNAMKYFGDSNVLRKSEFDVTIKREEFIRFFIEYGARRETTLWHIKAFITLRVNRADNSRLWEYTTDHTFTWNSTVCAVKAMSEINLKKNYDGRIRYEVVVQIVESEGFSKVECCYDNLPNGTTFFNVGEPENMIQIAAENQMLCCNSTVLKKFIDNMWDIDLQTNTRCVDLPGVSSWALESILRNPEALRNLNLFDPQNQEIPVLARLIQHKQAMEAISENMQSYAINDRFRIAEMYTYDDVQAWCCSKIQTLADFHQINLDMLDERSAAAVFMALKNIGGH